LLAAMIAGLLINDTWRAWSDLIPATNALAGRGTLVPAPLIPATLFLLAMAWSFALTGALHSHWAVWLGVLGLFAVVALTWTGDVTGAGQVWIGPAALLATVLFFAARWRGRARPAVEFPILLALVSFTFIATQAQEVPAWRSSGIPLLLVKLNSHVASLSALVIPLLLLIGVSMANFTQQTASWAVEITRARLAPWVLYAILIVALALRLHHVSTGALEALSRDPARVLPGYLGALGVPLCVGLAWLLTALAGRRSRQAGQTDGECSVGRVAASAGAVALVLIVGYNVVQLYAFVLLDLTLTFAANFPVVEVSAALERAVSGYVDFLNNRYTPIWHTVFYFLAIAAAVWQARLGRRALALYLCAFGLIALWLDATEFGHALEFLGWLGPAHTDFWWVAIFAAVGIAWAARRQLTPGRAAGLLFVVLAGGLLRQTAFINNRFSPFFSFAGVAFIAFGLVWDALTAGSWANVSSPELPRASRIFLYLGYVLLTVTLVNWALATHNLAAAGNLTGDTAVFGLDRFGKPMIYAVYVVVLATPFLRAERPSPAG
jgi:hypothetical protein